MIRELASSFKKLSRWLELKISVLSIISVSISLLSLPLGFSDSALLYAWAGAMFIIALIFSVEYNLAFGMKSISDFGFRSNREALKYDLFGKGMDWRLYAIGGYGMVSVAVLAMSAEEYSTTAAMLLAFASAGAVIQAMRLSRVWPVDKKN